MNFSKIRFDASSCDDTYNHRWFPYSKGGEYRKWYGNLFDVVFWENNGETLRSLKGLSGKLKSRPQNTADYFKPMITWSAISSSKSSMRYIANSIYGGGGTAYLPSGNIFYFLAFLNSKVAETFLMVVSPTLNYEAGHIMSLPLLYDDLKLDKISEVTQTDIRISKFDWDSYETSWDFKKHPLI